MTTHRANQVTMNRHYSILQVSKPVRPVKPLDQRHSKFSWVSCLDIVPFLFAFVFFVDMVKKARCLPCEFFFERFSFDGAGDEIREANEKEEGLQAIQATRIEEGKLQPIKQLK